MPHKAHKRYIGRAEKYKRHVRVYRLIWAFGLLALAVWLAFNWRWMYDYVRVAMMD